MATQRALFDDSPPSRAPATRGLQLRPQPSSPLSKKQQEFNRLVAKVERLRARLEADRRRFDDAIVFHAQHVRPHVERVVAIRKDLVVALQPFLRDRRLKPRDRQELRLILAEQLDDILISGGQLDDGLRALFETLHGEDLEVVEEHEMTEARAAMEAMLAELGIDVDLSGFHARMSEQEVAAKAAEMMDEMRRQAEAGRSGPSPHRRKRATKRELREEERRRQDEELRKTSLSAIYRRLAKVFHPDLEPDPESRAYKSALMQELTSAYAAGDLHTLLRLELEWIHGGDADVSNLTDEKLNACNQVLKHQVADLQAEISLLPHHPKYAPLLRDAGPFGTVLQCDGPAEVCRLDELAAGLTATLERLQTPRALQEVRRAIRIHGRRSEIPY